MPVLTYVYEDAGTSRYTDHDQLFKELIHTFFAEFLELFFPEVHRWLLFCPLCLAGKSISNKRSFK